MSSSWMCVRGSQLINYLQCQAARRPLFVSSSMAPTQDPAIDQVQSQAKHFPPSTAWRLCPAPGPPLLAAVTALTALRGRRGGGFRGERVPSPLSRAAEAAPGESIHLPALLSPCWLCSYRVFLFVQSANYCSVRWHLSSPNCSTLNRILKQIEMKRASSSRVCAEKPISF